MDFVDYSASGAGVSVDLSSGTLAGGDAANDTLSGGIDGIIGSAWNDTLTGYDGQGAGWTNVFYGGAGDDLIDGRGGDDLLYGGDGDDTIIGGTGADLIEGGAGDDLILVGSGDTVFGGAGNDTFVLDATALGGGTITIDGGETDEPGGDTLNFGGLLDWEDVVYNNTDPNALSGTATLSDGTVVTFSNMESVIICFTAGTRILTPHGPRPVEDLRPGDLVITRDNGPQPLRWTGRREVVGHGDFALRHRGFRQYPAAAGLAAAQDAAPLQHGRALFRHARGAAVGQAYGRWPHDHPDGMRQRDLSAPAF